MIQPNLAHATFQTDLAPPIPRVEPAFHVFTVYDTLPAALQARWLMNPLIRNSLGSGEFHRDELAFAEISHPDLVIESLELARDCDLFILATLEEETLPAPVAEWISFWLETRSQKETALVFLSAPPPSGNTSPLHQELLRLATVHGLSFFSSYLVPTEVSRSLHRRSPAYIPQPEGWGIND